MKLLLKYLFFFLLLPCYSFATGNISGLVTDAASSPISGATVALYKNLVLIDSTTTAGDGTYSLTNLSPGTYSIIASATSYQTATQGVNVKNNQTVTANFSLAGNPGTIAGQVTDADTTNPISGATVTVTQNGIVVGSAVTNGTGDYSATGIPPGSCVVTASASTYQTGILGAVVSSDQTTTVDFALESNPGTLSGTITDSSSMLPIEDAVIQVLLGGEGTEVIFATTSAADGTYSISGIAAGSYVVVGSASGYQAQTSGAIITEGGTTTLDFALVATGGTLVGTVSSASTGAYIVGALVEANQDNVIIGFVLTDSDGQYVIEDLPEGSYIIHCHASDYQMALVATTIATDAITNVNFSLLSNPGTLSGTVTSAATNLPIAGAIVELIADSNTILTGLTDSSGQYSFTGIFSGSFVMHAHASSYQTGVVSVDLSSGTANTQNFSLSANPATLTGTVTDASTTNPISSVLVEVHTNNQLTSYTYTDSSGNYSISGLAPGSVTVHAHQDSYQTQLKSATLTENQTTVVDFALASNPSTVSGTITDALTGIAISGAFVYISLDGGDVVESTITMGNGAYSIGELYPDSFTLSAQKRGYIANSTSAFTISSGGETVTKNLSLYSSDEPPTSLTGDVLLNKFALQIDRVHQLTWQPSPSPEVVQYRIYRNGTIIGNIAANISPLIYMDHNRSAKVSDDYTVTSINSDGSESSGISVSLK